MTVEFLERVDDKSPSTSGFNKRASRAQMRLLLDSEYDKQTALRQLLGYTTHDNTHVGLRRFLPAAHPEYPWLYATNISNVQGFSRNGRSEPTSWAYPASPDTYEKYVAYEFLVDYEPLPYTLLRDDQMQKQEITWYDEFDNPPETVEYYQEWYRYTRRFFKPEPEALAATQGSMVFRLKNSIEGGAVNPTDPDYPHLSPWSGTPYMMTNKGTFTVRWYEVPLNWVFVEDAYLTKYIGYINQYLIFSFDPGQLLYLGPQIVGEPYKMPFPIIESNNQQELNDEWFVDIDLVFSATRQKPTKDSTAHIEYHNWIKKGHNLMPHLKSRGWYYGTTTGSPDDNPAQWHPTYLSFPFQLLFRNPYVA